MTRMAMGAKGAGTEMAGPRVAASGAVVMGLGSCPLVLGECVQGRLREGPHFLITSPLGLFSWAEFTPGAEPGRIVVEPPDRCKALAAVESYLAGAGLPLCGRLRVFTPLPAGLGFGTSTADIVASVRAAAAAWRRAVTPERLAGVAAAIEPTDGSMYAECVAFAHREGALLERLGHLPRFDALVAVTGGCVDTVAFDRKRDGFRYSERDLAKLVLAWDMVREANRRCDLATLCRAATLSARINQQFLPKPCFTEMLRFAQSCSCGGLMAAHSGSVLAIILDPSSPSHPVRLKAGGALLSGLGLPGWFHLASRQRFLPPDVLAPGLAPRQRRSAA
jgi:uncharacterized protein involved in propanediol utilization